MDMFDAIGRALEKADPPIADRMILTKFAGYDGNNEGKFMTFSEFTVEQLRRFEYLPTEHPGYWNSHVPMRDTYNRMLTEWRKIPVQRRFEMTREELNSVLAAAVHQENRE
jgi:uncharacterized protein YfbU (UPF0304 family)